MTLRDKHIAIALRGVVDERTKKLARALAGTGANVTIYAFTFNREVQSGQPYCVKYYDSVEPKGSTLAVRVLRIAHNLTIKKIQERYHIARWGEFGYRDMMQVLIQAKPDLLIAVNADTLAACACAAESLDISYVYESYEFWPDHVREHACKLTARQRRFLIESEEKYANKAVLMVVVSDYIAQEYASDLHLSQKPEVIYNAPETTADAVSSAHQPLKILFLGNIQRERNVEMLLRAAAKVSGVTLTFQGRGTMAKELEAEAKRLHVSERVFFNLPVPYAQVAQSASHYDVGVVCHEAYNRQMEGALPNKFFEYMAGGLAVLAPSTEAFKMIENFDLFGVLIEANSADSLAESFEFLRDNACELMQKKEQALHEAQKYCGEVRRERIAQMYEEALRD